MRHEGVLWGLTLSEVEGGLNQPRSLKRTFLCTDSLLGVFLCFSTPVPRLEILLILQPVTFQSNND
ncbi:LOW QUALITY PROTEIN: hypothetical protein PanWU01x14_113330 [Parasponia andersonii]|uniref:Uncharacterized protein n=1 Tax=Parasponia andersonii TaxID=3476 RepID=A0A2P5CXS5_PARAD|nr:LOW QUALITY PROTEIN: hypothetical protein PanWU01x14_113330 [Parasponia andersonii]